jgi:fructose/tagatose bisphosphate aldolase
MTQSIPPKDEAGKARVEKLKRMKAHDIAPLAVFLASEQASYVNGQVFGQRAGELAVYDLNRPVMMIHDHDWTPELVGEKAMHAFRSRMTPLQVTSDVFPYDPMD